MTSTRLAHIADAVPGVAALRQCQLLSLAAELTNDERGESPR